MTTQNIIIQGITYDDKSSYMRGSALGPPLIRDAFYSESINAYAENGKCVTTNKAISFAKDFKPHSYFDGIYDCIDSHIIEGNKVISLGGDHSVSYPVIAAHAKHYEDIEILHIDAHSDLYHEFEGDPHSHACPFARIMESQLATRLVQVGIRCLTPHLVEQGEKYKVEVVEMKDYSLSALPVFNNPIYLSLDLDALDPAFAPGVSHHEPGGFSTRQVLDIIHSINVPIIGADIVEYNPKRDHAQMTAALAGKLLKEILSMMI